MRCPKNLFCGVKVHYINKFVSHHRRMARLYFYCTYYGRLHEVRRQAWWLFPLGAVREIPFALFASKRHSSDLEMKPLAPFQQTGIFIVTLRPLYSARLETHHTSVSLSMALTAMAAYPEVSPDLNCLFVLLENSCWEQTTAEQWANTKRAFDSWTASSFGSQNGTV